MLALMNIPPRVVFLDHFAMQEQPTRKILLLAANPKIGGQVVLNLDEEVRQIQEALQRSRGRDGFGMVYRTAVRPRDVQRAMLESQPQIVHFCGHGEGERGLVLEDEQRVPKLVQTEALANLFKLFAQKVNCVVLNACYSEVQAKAIAQHIPFVIGMNQPIGDRAAIEFATSFYDGLGAGESIEFAFELGVNAMQLAGTGDDQVPQLICRQSDPSPGLTHPSPPRIFISYKRDIEPDEPLALAIRSALAEQHQVFIDQTMLVGTSWVDRIEAEIRQADALIVLLSEHSVNSEMVEQEIRLAHGLFQQQGHPMILPVRVEYRQPFQYPLSQYLDSIHWAFWEDEKDTPRLLNELMGAIAGSSLPITAIEDKQALLQLPEPAAIPRPHPMAQPITLGQPSGTMELNSPIYIERDSDAIALAAIQQSGVTITIKAPRQMGKSSLLIRTMTAAQRAEKRVVFLDFQLFDHGALGDSDRFFREFATWLTYELDIEDKVAEYWQNPLGNSQRCTRYLERHVLPTVDGSLVLAMDEVESVFDTPFRSDFFSMLRSWHNKRAAMSIWQQLDLVLVTSTEPYQLIENLNQSPFNVGTVIELQDFSLEQVAELNRRHGEPLSETEVGTLMDWLQGHPFLVRRSLYLVASGQMTVTELLSGAIGDMGAFGDHLRHHLFRLSSRQDLQAGMVEVLGQQSCEESVFFRLRGAGLVRKQGRSVLPRCRLYAAYFGEQFL
jgi:hypothetical protein